MESECQLPSWRCVSLWVCLNLWLIPPKNNIIYVSGDWWFQINYFDSDKSLFLRELAWRPSSITPILHDGMCKATTPVFKERCLTSEAMEASRRRRSIGGWFWTYVVVNAFDTKLFSHVLIGIDHGRDGVTATTPSWFVVRRRDVPRVQLEGRPGAGQQITRVLMP